MISRTPAVADARHALRGLVAGGLDDERILDAHARAVWSGIVEPGDRIAARLIARVGASSALEAVRSGTAAPEVATPREWVDALARWRPRAQYDGAAHAGDAARRVGARLITPHDAEWPTMLDDLGDHAPLCLWARGRPLADIPSPGVALVGARAASAYGEQVAIDLAAEVSVSGAVVISGAAYGIDGAAHRAALTAGGTTVALLAGGVDRPYPAGHAGLIDQIATAGVLLSEVPCGSAPTKWRFLQRNRLIAALSDATVVVEAGWRSGSLNTAGHAATLGRPLGAVPGPITSATSAGCHRLLRDFDARCITSADDVRELLGLGSATVERRSGGAPRTDDASRVRDALSTRGWRDTDDVARRCGMALIDVEAILGVMLLEGAAEHGSRGWRMLSRAAHPG